MKNLILLLFVFSAISFSSFGQVDGNPVKPEVSNWTQKDRADFVGECVKAASAGMSIDSAKYYCHCMQEIMEEKYPDVQKAGAITEAELASPEWKKLITECIRTYWTAKERAEFLSDCVAAASPNIGVERAKSYCDCMLYKVQRFYPVFLNTSELTDEKLKSPQWQKIIGACLEF